ncbi:hypothetical protein Pan44_11010 [Caulifigura coniformis]|uniref:Uncharacterized protein n=1 Tax=Caulifigura coniformis TaxID=2527983 RepID=A0A517SAI3_9PLAN|nr:hypothetical protein Pan44_11010 [Caulifigura coniformis]
MVDRQAFVYVPGDIRGLFRRLNGASMVDILETLDALLKEKNFFRMSASTACSSTVRAFSSKGWKWRCPP